MNIPVTRYQLCSGTGPEDPDKQVHGVFKSETACRRILNAALAEFAAGELLLASVATVFAEPTPGILDAPSFEDAVARGYQLNFDSAALLKALQSPAAAAAPVEAAPVDVILAGALP